MLVSQRARRCRRRHQRLRCRGRCPGLAFLVFRGEQRPVAIQLSLVQCAPHRGHGRIEMSGVMQALQAGAIRVAGLQAASFGAAGTSAHMLAQRNSGPESNVTKSHSQRHSNSHLVSGGPRQMLPRRHTLNSRRLMCNGSSLGSGPCFKASPSRRTTPGETNIVSVRAG